MKVEIKKASVQQKPILQNLLQLYLYDFSEFAGADVNEEGIFEDRNLDTYWQSDPTRIPFLVFVDEKIAGFVLLNSKTCLYKQGEAKAFAEFFVMRKYRNKGIGKKVAFTLFEKFPGKWEIRQLEENKHAQEFWRKIIREYTKGNFQEIARHKKWRGPIQTFDNSNKI